MKRESNPALASEIEQFYKSNSGLILVALCTPDGFPIEQCSPEFDSVPDKIAAMTSTLSSVSNAIANEIIAAPFTVSCIETDAGNCISIYTNYCGSNAVLTIAARQDTSLGELRVRTKRLAEKISLINNQ